MRTLFCHLAILGLAAGASGQVITDQTAVAKDLLRRGQAKYDWSTPVTLVVANEKSGTFQKWIRGRSKGIPAGLAFRPTQTAEEALAVPTSMAAHLYVGREHWMVSSVKKMALRLDLEKDIFVAPLAVEDMRVQSPRCAVDFFEDPEISHSLSHRVEQGISYRVVTRGFTKKFLQTMAACAVAPLGVINSEFLLIPEKNPGKPVYPDSVEYSIDEAGYIRIWRSYSATGQLLSERRLVHVAPYEGNVPQLFAIPKDYTLEIVKNATDMRKAMKKFVAK